MIVSRRIPICGVLVVRVYTYLSGSSCAVIVYIPFSNSLLGLILRSPPRIHIVLVNNNVIFWLLVATRFQFGLEPFLYEESDRKTGIKRWFQFHLIKDFLKSCALQTKSEPLLFLHFAYVLLLSASPAHGSAISAYFSYEDLGTFQPLRMEMPGQEIMGECICPRRGRAFYRQYHLLQPFTRQHIAYLTFRMYFC